MTNTVARLDAAGYVHVRPDWEDARRKWVIAQPGRARPRATAPSRRSRRSSTTSSRGLGAERMRAAVPVLRRLRELLDPE